MIYDGKESLKKLFKDKENSIDEIEKFIVDNSDPRAENYLKLYWDNISKKANKFIEEGYTKFVGFERDSFVCSSQGVTRDFFLEYQMDNFKGREFGIAIFENDEGKKRYITMDSENGIINKSLSKLKYEDETTKESKDYKMWLAAKDAVESFNEKGLMLNQSEIYILYRKTKEDDLEKLSQNLLDDIKDVLTNETDFAATSFFEMYHCGRSRGSEAVAAVFGIQNAGYVAHSLGKSMQCIANEMYNNNELMPNIQQAEKLHIENHILGDIIENKDFDKLDSFLIQQNGKPFPISLVKTIKKAIKEIPEQIDIRKIDSNLTKSLFQMRRYHPELNDNKFANNAILQYITNSDVNYNRFVGEYLQPDFFERLQKGETLKDIVGEKYVYYNLNSEFSKIRLRKAFNELNYNNENIVKLAPYFKDENLEYLKELVKEGKDITMFENIDIYTLNSIASLMREGFDTTNLIDFVTKKYCDYNTLKMVCEANEQGIDLIPFLDNGYNSKDLTMIFNSLSNENSQVLNIINNIDELKVVNLMSNFDNHLTIRNSSDPDNFGEGLFWQTVSLDENIIIHQNNEKKFAKFFDDDGYLTTDMNEQIEYEKCRDAWERWDRKMQTFCDQHKLAISMLTLGKLDIFNVRGYDKVQERKEWSRERDPNYIESVASELSLEGLGIEITERLLRAEIMVIEKTLEANGIDVKNINTIDIDKLKSLIKNGKHLSDINELTVGTLDEKIEVNEVACTNEDVPSMKNISADDRDEL